MFHFGVVGQIMPRREALKTDQKNKRGLFKLTLVGDVTVEEGEDGFLMRPWTATGLKARKKDAKEIMKVPSNHFFSAWNFFSFLSYAVYVTVRYKQGKGNASSKLLKYKMTKTVFRTPPRI